MILTKGSEVVSSMEGVSSILQRIADTTQMLDHTRLSDQQRFQSILLQKYRAQHPSQTFQSLEDWYVSVFESLWSYLTYFSLQGSTPNNWSSWSQSAKLLYLSQSVEHREFQDPVEREANELFQYYQQHLPQAIDANLMNRLCRMIQFHTEAMENTERAQNRTELLRENLLLMNNRLVRMKEDQESENQALKANISALEEVLIAEQSRSAMIESTLQHMLRSLQEEETSEYRKNLVHSIQQTLSAKLPLLEEQQEQYEEDAVEPISLEALKNELDQLTLDDDPFDSSSFEVDSHPKPLHQRQGDPLVALQHFGYLHEIINGQKEKIISLQLQMDERQLSHTLDDSDGECDSEPPNNENILQQRQEEFSKMKEEKTSMVDYLQTLQSQIQSLQDQRKRMDMPDRKK